MIVTINNQAFDFQLPKALEIATPTEERGMRRDAVKLLVSERYNNKITHTRFSELSEVLKAGDVLVVNTSGTLPAALPVHLKGGGKGRIHLSTKLSEREWLVEIRKVENNSTIRLHESQIGIVYHLPKDGKVKIESAYFDLKEQDQHLKLYKATFDVPLPMADYMMFYGHPIRYSNLDKEYPIDYYQTVFAQEWGSSEMPSAGRAFTKALVMDLILKGVQFAPIVLHTGVSSLEADEEPYPEYFRVPDFTASLVNLAKAEGRRIIAVGTTAIRAIESAIRAEGKIVAQEGMTDLFITPERGLGIVNGLLTGFHEPNASHLLMMEALANRQHLELSYASAIQEGYQWHEFGDLHLIL